MIQMTNNNITTTYTYSYWKSTLTGAVYQMPVDWMPQFGGWEPVHEETYLKANGIIQ